MANWLSSYIEANKINISFPPSDEFTLVNPQSFSDVTLSFQLLNSAAALFKAYAGVAICPYDDQTCGEEDKMTIWGR